jgi:23S rRNA (adenine2503-C2)-methyltransferase
MLKRVNDSPADAKALSRLVAGIPAKFNLITFNVWPGAPFKCSCDESMIRFSHILDDTGYTAPVRTPRTRDIMAACGQLRSAPTRALGRTEAGAHRRASADHATAGFSRRS